MTRSLEAVLTTWLEWLGFSFDPFLPLDAAADPHLSRYMVHHDAFVAIWGTWPSFALAPPGGGKTALRLRAVEACYIGQSTNRPFPVQYVPPLLTWRARSPTLEDHLAAMARAGATQLLLSLAYRPHWFFRLDETGRKKAKQVLDWNLPGPLRHYLDVCRATRSPQPLRERFGPAVAIPDPPDETTLLHFCAALEAMPVHRAPVPPPAERWETFVELILFDFRFEAIYALLDGLDAAPETAHDSSFAVSLLAPLLSHVEEWSDRRVFLKSFLPLQVRPLLATKWGPVLDKASLAVVEWSLPLLVELVKQRVFVATGGAFDSLNAVATPDTPNVEWTLAATVETLPQEMLVLTRRVFWEHVQREGPHGLITPDDLEAALSWYREERRRRGEVTEPRAL